MLKRQRLIHRVARDDRSKEVLLFAVAQRREVNRPLLQLGSREEALGAARVRRRRSQLNALARLRTGRKPVDMLIGGRRVDTYAVELDGRRRIENAFSDDVDRLLLAVDQQAQVAGVNIGIEPGSHQLRLRHSKEAFTLYADLRCRLSTDDGLD